MCTYPVSRLFFTRRRECSSIPGNRMANFCSHSQSESDRMRCQAKSTCSLAHSPRKNHVTANTTRKIYSTR